MCDQKLDKAKHPRYSGTSFRQELKSDKHNDGTTLSKQAEEDRLKLPTIILLVQSK